MRKFWQQGVSSLRKEITLIITVKIIVIFLLWWVFFSNPSQPPHPLLQQLTQPQPENRANHDNNA